MVDDSAKNAIGSSEPVLPPMACSSAQTPMMSAGDGDEREDGVHRGAPGRVDVPDEARQQALAARVEHQPGLRVGARDERAQGGGHPGQVGEEGQHANGAVGHRDERDRGRAELAHVVAEPADRGVGEHDVADGHDGHRGEHGARHVAPRVVGLLGQRGRVLPADEQVDGQREAGRQPGEAVGDVARLERDGGQVAAVLDQRLLPRRRRAPASRTRRRTRRSWSRWPRRGSSSARPARSGSRSGCPTGCSRARSAAG